MKKLFFVFILLTIVLVCNVSAQDVLTKTCCLQAVGDRAYQSVDDLKKALLSKARIEAFNDIFQQSARVQLGNETMLISEHPFFSGLSDYLTIINEPVYRNGDLFGQVCVTIAASISGDRIKEILPVSIVGEGCVKFPDLSEDEQKKRAREKAVIFALLDHEIKLYGRSKKQLLDLIHSIKVIDTVKKASGSLCVTCEGLIYPLEIQSVTQSNIEMDKKPGRNSK